MRSRLPVLLVMLLAAACSSSAYSPSSASSPASGKSSAPVATDALTIAGFAYSPTPLTVAPGQKVDVTNNDTAAHTVTSDTTGLFLTGGVATGQHVTFTAPSRAGTYTFHCQYHPSMHGTLVVKG